MNLTQEEKDKLKAQTLELTDAVYKEIQTRIQTGELSLEKLSIKELLTQFKDYMNLLKVQQPKIALSIPINFDEKKMRKVEGMYEAKKLA